MRGHINLIQPPVLACLRKLLIAPEHAIGVGDATADCAAYLAAGIPILGMLDGEGARIIQESNAGFTCKAGDYQALVINIMQMSKLTRTERKAMGHQGRIYSQREFARELLIDRLEKWLIDLSGKAF